MTTRRSLFQSRPRQPALFVRAQDDDEVELLLYDEIGFWGITAKQMAETLAQIDADTIHLRINSPGGDVFDGVAIYNALRQHEAEVITHIDGLAASIASVIALAGAEVRMAPNAFFMIHNPWGITIGDAATHRKMADTLDKIALGAIASTYEAKTGKDLETIETWMDEETWFTATEAEDAGFVDVVEEAAPAAARLLPFDLSIYQHVPAAVQYALPGDDERSIKEQLCEFEGILKGTGLSHRDRERAVAAFKQYLQTSAGEPGTTPRGVGVVPDSDAEAAAQELLGRFSLAAINPNWRSARHGRKH